MTQDYIKTEWVDKQTIITAENMNKIEEQIDVVTDDVIAIKEKINPELVESLAKQVTEMSSTIQSMNRKISDLEVKLHYVNSSEKQEIVGEVSVNQTTAKIDIEPGQVVKAVRLVEMPEGSVKWRNKCSSFFGIDATGKTTGTSNPSNVGPAETKFEHLGNLDPTLGVQELDRIEDLYSILADFDFDKAAAKEFEDIIQYHPDTIKIKRVRHMIEILNAEEEVIEKINVDIYNPN